MPLPTLEVPTYTAKLPSTNQHIIYRPFLVKEHKILLTLSEADNEEVSRVIAQLVDACTFKKLDIEKLASFDLEYLFLLLRARSIGETMDLVLTCKNCGHKNDVKTNLLEAKVVRPEDHNKIIRINEGISLVMRYPKLKDILHFFQNTNQEEIYNFVLDSIESVIVEEEVFDTKDQTREDLDTFVNSMSKAQFDLIENFFNTMPKVVQHIEKECESCNFKNEVNLEGLENFFV